MYQLRTMSEFTYTIFQQEPSTYVLKTMQSDYGNIARLLPWAYRFPRPL